MYPPLKNAAHLLLAAMSNRREKMVNLRVSDEEYRTFLGVSHRRGENISDLIRTTMQYVYPSDFQNGDRDLLALRDRVRMLAEQVRQLRGLIIGPAVMYSEMPQERGLQEYQD